MMKNKKGEISVTILVIGVIVLSALAMFTFFVSDYRLSNSFVGVGVMEKMNAAVDEYLFYQNVGASPDKIRGYFPREIVTENRVNYFEFGKNSSGVFGKGSNNVVFSVKYPLG
jgi:hypothetical protein